ncbi:YceI family protein [uncultured Tenacibaculum sp.]|uniref:YceI family protein n=1 Tax=uncultured Tenacibaculum sp. TaxID=174713 RepID=UPI00262DCA98|nr:YceI family protein [uncultured Tenacibaculum sp.]
MRLFVIILLISQSIFSQKYYTRTGSTGFKASVDAFEPVQALNKSTTAILTSKGEIASQLFISAFKFRLALMQEHFNESFMESNEFPKAVFRGKIEDFDLNSLTGTKDVTIKGNITIKGVSKEIETKGTVSKVDDKINLATTFKLTPGDFNIKIPSVVRRKIARIVTVDLNYDFSEKK